MPSYPARTLGIHCAVKGSQVGSVLGLAVITPILAWRRKKPMSQMWKSVMLPATLFGTALSSGLLYYKDVKGSLDIAGVDDRAFRIVNSPGQNKVDLYSAIGVGVGATSGVVVGGAVVPFACTGIALGVAFYGAEKYYLANKVQPVTKEEAI